MTNPPITPKQLDIIHLLHRFRFLDRPRIQTILNHKNHRRILTWLKDLTEKNIIGRKYAATVRTINEPAIYYLSSKSRPILLEQFGADKRMLKRVYKEKSRSNRFIHHQLFLADLYIFFRTEAAKDNLSLNFKTNTDLASHHGLPFKRPDALLALTDSKKQTARYFLEIIDEGTPRFSLRKKISQYIDYFDDHIWQDRTGFPFPFILFICPNQTIKHYFYHHIAKTMEDEGEDDMQVFLTTKDEVLNSQLATNVWQRVALSDT